MKRDPYHEFQALRSYYQTRTLLKTKQIKYNLVCALSVVQTQDAAQNGMRDTRSGFIKLERQSEMGESSQALAQLHVERMRGLYSYNVLDSPDYIQAKRIEKRIAIYDKKMREK